MLAKQLKMKQTKREGGFLIMLLVALGAILFGNLSAGKGVIRPSERTFRIFSRIFNPTSFFN